MLRETKRQVQCNKLFVCVISILLKHDLSVPRCPMCRAHVQSFFLIGDESGTDEQDSSDGASQDPTTVRRRNWRQRLGDLNSRIATAMGMQEN